MKRNSIVSGEEEFNLFEASPPAKRRKKSAVGGSKDHVGILDHSIIDTIEEGSDSDNDRITINEQDDTDVDMF